MPEVKLKFTADTAEANRGVDKIKSSLSDLKSMGASFGGVLAKGLAGLSVGLIAVGAAAVRGLKDVIDFAGEIKDISDSTGISIKSLIELREQFRQAGVDTGRLQFVLANMSNTLQDPNEDTLKWLEKWGVSIEEIESMNIADRFQLIGEKIGGMATQAERLKASKDMFGKAGADLVRLFDDAESKLNAQKMLGDLPNTMAIIASTLESAGDIFDGLTVKWLQFFAGFASQLLDPIKEAAELVKNLDLSDWGVQAGMFVNTLTDAFKNGQLVDVIGGAFLGGMLKVAVELAAVLTFVLEKAVSSVIKKFGLEKFLSNAASKVGLDESNFDAGAASNTIKNTLLTLLGGPLGMGAAYLTTGTGGDTSYSEHRANTKEMLSEVVALSDDLLSAYKNMRTSSFRMAKDITLTAEEMAKLVQSGLDEIREAASKAADRGFTSNLWSDAVDSENASNWAQNFLGIKGAADFKPEEKKEGAFKQIEPVISSLARVGGARGETNSVMRYQNQSLIYQRQIANNTAKLTGGAVIG